MDTGGFKSHQVDDYVTSFKENGYVVIEDVLNLDEIKRSVNEVRISPDFVSSVPLFSPLFRFGNTLRKMVT